MGQPAGAQEPQTDEEYDATIEALMEKVGVVCDGAPIGVTACALFNCLCSVAEQTTAEMRKVMLESAAELVTHIEAIDAPRH
jgi:hypothetical protein